MGEVMEFFISGSDVWCRSDGLTFKFEENRQDVVDMLLSKIDVMFPDAGMALRECYAKSAANVPYFRYLCARRFCKCNFGRLDDTKDDIDADGTFSIEKVDCPLRGECCYEGRICLPKFNSKLSDAETRVMKLVYEGMDCNNIAKELYLSPNTVKNHIKNVYMKLGIHSRVEFVRHATEYNLFNN